MAGFVAGTDRGQSTLLPECLDDWVDESNPIRVIDAFVDTLDCCICDPHGMVRASIVRYRFRENGIRAPWVHLV
jgi:hypothetical protein